MGFVRVWWPPVVLGLVVAFLGISVAEVAGIPAGGARVAASAPDRPQSQPTSIAPAAIESRENASEPEPEPRPRAKGTARQKPAVVATPKRAPTPPAVRTGGATPAPTRRPSPKPVGKRVEKPHPLPTPVLAPSLPPSPSPTPSPSPVSAVPPPPVRPAQVLDLRSWKLTLPVGRTGRPLEIRQPGLGAIRNGSYVRLRSDRGVMFRAPVGGVTTENSRYPRAELREMSADGQREAGWTNATGRHVMTITQAIAATPRVKPHVVAGQIHDGEDDVIMIRLERRRLFVESDGDDLGLLDAHYRLGTRFTVSIVARPSGIRVTYRRAGRVRVVHIRKVGQGWYFKAGCYVQSNPDRGDRPTAFGEVVVYALTVRHS